jgi:hypothetical protein
VDIETDIAEQIALVRVRGQRGIDIGLLVLRAHADCTSAAARAINPAVMAPSMRLA